MLTGRRSSREDYYDAAGYVCTGVSVSKRKLSVKVVDKARGEDTSREFFF